MIGVKPILRPEKLIKVLIYLDYLRDLKSLVL